ncbi:MAG: hypothetical protein DRR19_17905 [Candidatus Parabeggiatoa sp. nov. 1]|nr:MAG: hypothetical protein DRR19_17905 [Gammaproteobacteria bacterium]
MVQFTCNSVHSLKHFLLGLLATVLFFSQLPVQAHVQNKSTGNYTLPMPPYLLVGMEIRINFNEQGMCQLLIVDDKNEQCSKLSELIKKGFENNGIIIFDDHSSQWIPYRLLLFSQELPAQARMQNKSTGNWQQPMPPYLLVGMEIRVNFNEQGACQLLIVDGKNEQCSKLSELIKKAFDKNGIIIFDGHSSQWIPYRLLWW